ncbi:hypothetical protein BKP37_02735 [Anaerobacillus alkalilacustris]|uniref:DUF624 domain-containing protein n=1 Tax=Anaerobacillus alkalilacustris TaxID=393763 RepID=A0A1S2LYT6_9BACI|nr:DUF624 domain-containing protein [Anaerobacillus alkalilacustris]OIJ17434.1 hypothetical protein BKP37_02735 [Anaerobacillus alkalilacustris]
MKTEGFIGKVYYGLDLFMKIAYINLLWIIFTVIGLVIFGVAPASVALLTIIRKWLIKDTDIPILSTFFQVYKKEFLKSNLAGLFFLLVFIVLYIQFSYIPLVDSFLQVILTIGLIINGMIFLVTFIYFFPIYVHYNLKFHEYFKRSFLMGMINIHVVLLICFCFFLIYHLLVYFPVYVGLFLPGIVGLVLMSITLLAFNKFEEKKARLKK